MFIFLTVVQALVAAALVGVILIQKSEGGGLGVGGGGSPSGLMSARGAADFLTRSTAVLATIFVLLSILLAALAVDVTTGREIDTSLERGSTPSAQPDPLAPAANQDGAAAPEAAPPEGAPKSDDPLAGAVGQ
ncbi:preprotein translocase subunit SecG [Novosphingobium sp. PC22D]|uniref:preprotein translocase subunit SecG n=1 Tax=Novosphingobium sp. PC22D TaxID=1962403 RepID=UPI000BF17B5B|nr:preprotein translocase subunit SecG [Novosphingobium sp. PC22D]PEQ13462.1 preprotein translocase subunit SecG [Novosphingobium sp. PC22D]